MSTAVSGRLVCVGSASSRSVLSALAIAAVLACTIWISAPVRGDFSRSDGFETPAEVKRPPRMMPTSRPDDKRIAQSDRLYCEAAQPARQAADSQRRIWLIASGIVIACVVVAAVYWAVFRPRGSSR